MKAKKYLEVMVTRMDGTTFYNPLKMAEANLIPQIVKDNLKITVCYCECTPERYKVIFG